MRRYAAFLTADLHNLTRDPVLLALLFVPLPLGAAIRFGWPAAVEALAPLVEIGSYRAFAITFFLILTPGLLGMATGFVMLDEREEGVLSAVAVTPVGLAGLLGYRLVAPAALCFAMNLALLWLAGAAFAPWRAPAAAAMAALEAPLMAVLLAGIAHNKVEGMALAKGLSFFFLGPFAILFLASPWYWAGAPLPTFWVAKLLADSGSSPFPALFWAAFGFAYHLVALWGAALYFVRRAR